METSADICRLGFICHHDAGGYFTPISDLRERSRRSAILPHPLVSNAKRRMVWGEGKSPGDYRRKIFKQQQLRSQRGGPGPHGAAASGRAVRPWNPGGDEARQPPPRGTILVFPDLLNIAEGLDVF